MREKIGKRPYEITKKEGKYVIKFYPMIKNAKKPDRVLFCLTVSKQEFDNLAVKIFNVSMWCKKSNLSKKEFDKLAVKIK